MSPELAHALNAVDPQILGARLKASRVAAGLTQPALAGEDASVTYVSRIESGQRRAGPELLTAFAQRLGVNVEYLVLGDVWEDSRRTELQLDHAELALVGGEAQNALTLAREVLASTGLDAVADGWARARYVEAAALETLGAPDAASAFRELLACSPDWQVAVKAATALSRLLREEGDLPGAIGAAQAALDDLPDDVRGGEESVRLSVTLAAALFEAGRTQEAAALCDAAIADAERLSSPVARASAYWNASVIRAEAGDLGEALGLARRALHLLETTERVRDLGRLRTQLSAIMLRTDPPRVEDARHQLRIADTELDWSEASPADKAWNGLVNARAFFMAGDSDEAHSRALAALDSIGDELSLVSVDTMILLGQVAWATQDRDEARDWYRQAIMRLTGIGADREAAQLWFELGTLADQVDLVDEARDAYRRAASSSGLTARLPVTPNPSRPRTTPASTGPEARMPVTPNPPTPRPRTTVSPGAR